MKAESPLVTGWKREVEKGRLRNADRGNGSGVPITFRQRWKCADSSIDPEKGQSIKRAWFLKRPLLRGRYCAPLNLKPRMNANDTDQSSFILIRVIRVHPRLISIQRSQTIKHPSRAARPGTRTVCFTSYWRKRSLYSPETRNALTISARSKLPSNSFNLFSQKWKPLSSGSRRK